MKKIVFLMSILISFQAYGNTTPSSVLPGNLTTLELLIKATEQQHELQVALRDEIVEYERLRDLYYKKPEDKEMLFRVIQRADRVLTQIKQAKLTYLFDAEFMKELNLFSKFAKKI